MSNFNKVLLLGRLTRDPELRTFSSGTAVCKFGMATNHSFTDREGNRREETTFVDVESFGKQAETISRYMKKGRSIFVEGRLKLDQWETKDGEKRSKLLVALLNFQFIGGDGDGAPPLENGGASNTPTSKPASDSPSSPPQDTPPPSPSKDTETQADNIEEDDVPF